MNFEKIIKSDGHLEVAVKEKGILFNNFKIVSTSELVQDKYYIVEVEAEGGEGIMKNIFIKVYKASRRGYLFFITDIVRREKALEHQLKRIGCPNLKFTKNN